MSPILGSYLEQIKHDYFDTFTLYAPSPEPVVRLFCFPVGYADPIKCIHCGRAIVGPRRRTELDTNLEVASVLPLPRKFVVEELLIDFRFQRKLRQRPPDLAAFCDSYVLHFWIGKTAVLRLPVSDIAAPFLTGELMPGEESASKRHRLPEALAIETAQFFQPELRAEQPIKLESNLRARFTMFGTLFREVR